jgi:hypothetical protein
VDLSNGVLEALEAKVERLRRLKVRCPSSAALLFCAHAALCLQPQGLAPKQDSRAWCTCAGRRNSTSLWMTWTTSSAAALRQILRARAACAPLEALRCGL